MSNDYWMFGKRGTLAKPTEEEMEREYRSMKNDEEKEKQARLFFAERGIPFPNMDWQFQMNKILESEGKPMIL